MAFIELKSQRPRLTVSYTGDKVKLYFPIIHNKQQLVMLIGKDIINQLGYKHQDRVKLYIDDEDPFLWWLKKDDNGTWSLTDIYHNTENVGKLYKIQLVWRQEVPAKFKGNKKLYLTWKIHQGGLLMTLPGGKNEDSSL